MPSGLAARLSGFSGSWVLVYFSWTPQLLMDIFLPLTAAAASRNHRENEVVATDSFPTVRQSLIEILNVLGFPSDALLF